MSCGYTGYDFGAGYEDSICIDGFLWDADSYEDGLLTSGGEIPCPSCSTDAWLAFMIENELEQWSDRSSQAEGIEAIVRRALKENPTAAVIALRALPPFEAEDWPDRDAVRAGHASPDETVIRQWPWAIPGLTAHQAIAIRSGGAARGGVVDAAAGQSDP